MDSARLYDGVALTLISVAVLAPLPHASNAPVFWLGSAALIFGAAAAFFAAGQLPVRLGLFGPVMAGLAIYFAFLVVQAGAGTSIAPRATTLGMLRGLGYSVFFFLLVQVMDDRRQRWMVIAVFGSISCYALLGFLMQFGGGDWAHLFKKEAYPESVTGPFINRNSFATFLGFGILVGLALLLARAKRLRRAGMAYLADPRLVGLLSVLLLLVATQMATHSRMGVAATVLAAGLLVAGSRRAVILWGAGAALLSFALFGGAFLARMATVAEDADTRMALYAQMIEMIKDRPWVGHGLDSFALAFQSYHSLEIDPDLIWDRGHNSYLTGWVETGLVFGSIPVLLGLWLFVRLMAAKQRHSRLAAAAILLAGAHALVDFSLEIQANMYVFLAILALGASAEIVDEPGGNRISSGAKVR